MLSNQSYEERMQSIWSISKEVEGYIAGLHRYGLADACNKAGVRVEVRDLVSKGLSEQQIMNIMHKRYAFLAPGDIIICNNRNFMIDASGKHIVSISLDDVFNLLGDRLKNSSGKKLEQSFRRTTLSGTYIDGESIGSGSYAYAKIVCTDRSNSVRTVCSVSLFTSMEKPKAYIRDGMLAETLRTRIYRYVDDFDLTKDLAKVVQHISNPLEIEGMSQALHIIGHGPVVTFEKAHGSDTKHFDFITVEFDLVYNNRTYKEQVEFIKMCIKAFDILAVTAIKIRKTFKEDRIGLNYFKADKVLTKQNVLIYKFSIKGT